MKTNKKELYLTPEAEVFEVKIEGVICQSIPATMDGTWGEEDI